MFKFCRINNAENMNSKDNGKQMETIKGDNSKTVSELMKKRNRIVNTQTKLKMKN